MGATGKMAVRTKKRPQSDQWLTVVVAANMGKRKKRIYPYLVVLLHLHLMLGATELVQNNFTFSIVFAKPLVVLTAPLGVKRNVCPIIVNCVVTFARASLAETDMSCALRSEERNS